MERYRHGDVCLDRMEEEVELGNELPTDAQGRVVLAEGEVTGHGHRLKSKAAAFHEAPGRNWRVLVLKRPTRLFHEEHRTITLPPGKYKVRIKRQYNPEGTWSPVVD